MDGRDEELTIENVDERVEELSLFQVSQPPAMMPLARVVHDLHSFYEEEHTLEAIWERISSRTLAMYSDSAWLEVDELSLTGSSQASKKAGQARGEPDVGSLRSIPHGPKEQFRAPRRWRKLGAGLAAALVLIAILAWPAFSLFMHTTGSGPAAKTATPQSQPAANGLAMKEYTGQYFTIQYPAGWTIADEVTDGTSLQTVHFHPAAASSAEITVAVLRSSKLSSEQMLHMDSDVQRGTLMGTSTVTRHSIPWVVGLINLTSSTQASLGKLEIAYSNQQAPYKIECSTPPDLFAKYSMVFNAMLSSFYPQAQIAGAATATLPPTTTPSPTQKVPGMQEYSSQYFQIQYPANWVITSITTGNGYLQSVQFRPSEKSTIFVNVNAMHSSLLSEYLLLQLDPDVGLGGLLSTSTVTYHGIPWATDIVSTASSAHTQPGQMEIAYSNQQAPYRIEFGAPPGQFSAYSATFNAIFSSFYPAS
jgi:hypothetical protein